MPLTAEQEVWLNGRELDRAKKSAEVCAKLVHESQMRAEDEKRTKNDGAEGSKKTSTTGGVFTLEKSKIKYKSASEFMSTHFPSFDSNPAVGCGPMRREQLLECEQVVAAFGKAGMSVDPVAVAHALIVPQDRPEAICLEEMARPGERLMDNPLPQEFWRKKVTIKKKKKKLNKK